MKAVQVYFVNDSSANQNWGSRATSQLLKQQSLEAGGTLVASLPLADLNRPNWQTTPGGHKFYQQTQSLLGRSSFLQKAGSSLLNRAISRLPDPAPANWSQFESKAIAVKKGQLLPHIKEALEHCDMVLINGEGGILENQRESRMMLFIAYLAKTHFNKPVALVCHTADLSHPTLFEIAEQVYPLLDDVVFRDPTSFERYGALGKTRFAADVTFALEPAPVETWTPLAQRRGYFDHYPNESLAFDPAKPFICLGGSSSFSPRHQPGSNPQKALAQLAQSLSKLAQVVLVASALPDERILEPLAKELELPYIPLATAPLQGLDLLANASLYVGGRWHGAIFALRGGTPVIAFAAETFKLESLIGQYDLHPCFSSQDLAGQQDEMVRMSQSYLEQGQSLREKLKTRSKMFVDSSQEHVSLIRQLSQHPD